MIFHNGGKYSGNVRMLPQRTQIGAIQYKEPSNLKTLSRQMTILSICIFVFFYAVVCLRAGKLIWSWIGIILPNLFIIPHEFLHALCFRKDVYMYSNLKQGMMFVTGTEDLTKTHFIIMSLCPNLIFGLLPFLLFMFMPDQKWLGLTGTLSLCMGAGDYYNACNCMRQVPKGGISFLSGIHTYWYMP